MNNKVKKPWYKKWWLWVIVVIVLFIWIGGQNSGSSSSSSNSGSGSSATSVSKKPKPEVNTAKAATLGAGTFKVGRDLKPGRYVIKAVSGSGNVTSEGNSDINIILGTTPDDDSGQITSFTTDLKKNEKIKIDGIQSTSFTPTPSKRTYKTTLSAGNWVVGKDIKPGRYVIKAVEGSGNLLSDNGDINSILGTSADSTSGQVTHVTVDLTNNEVLSTDLQSISLTAK